MPGFDALMPLFVLGGIFMAIWAALSWISQRNARTHKRGRDDVDHKSI
jgi:hypothetical protein